MARVALTEEAVKQFQKPLAKKKLRQQEHDADEELATKHAEYAVKKSHKREDGLDHRHASPAEVRGVMSETMARVYEEMWPRMTTHDELGNVDIEINEETYILSLTMFTGNPNYIPRRALKIRDKEGVSEEISFCPDHDS